MRRRARILLLACATHRHFGVAQPLAPKGVNDVLAWFSGHQTIALFTGEAGCFGTPGGNHHGRLFRGAVVEFGIVNLQMFAAIGAEFTGKQALNDLNCLMQALVPFQQSRPPLTNDVFVEPSPEPRPSVKRSALRRPRVAAPCAIMAG